MNTMRTRLGIIIAALALAACTRVGLVHSVWISRMGMPQITWGEAWSRVKAVTAARFPMHESSDRYQLVTDPIALADGTSVALTVQATQCMNRGTRRFGGGMVCGSLAGNPRIVISVYASRHGHLINWYDVPDPARMLGYDLTRAIDNVLNER